MDLYLSLCLRFLEKMDLCLVLIWVYIVSNVLSERLNITGGSFRKDSYMNSNPLIVLDNLGPRQCIRQCLLYNGCYGVNFLRYNLNCELITLQNFNYPLSFTGHIFFTEMTDWKQDKNVCWPNPCTGETKCEAANYNQYICVTYDTPCSIHPCYNSGTCRNHLNTYSCICPAGYSGSVCQYTPCSYTYCNWGYCVVSGSSAYCSCYYGYNGDSCQYSYTYINDLIFIMSPNYPLNYYDNAVISWSYRTDVGRRIVILALAFDLEENRDWLKVYHRPDKITELASWTGILYSAEIVYSHDNYIYIEFTSDSSITSTGFQIGVRTE